MNPILFGDDIFANFGISGLQAEQKPRTFSIETITVQDIGYVLHFPPQTKPYGIAYGRILSVISSQAKTHRTPHVRQWAFEQPGKQ